MANLTRTNWPLGWVPNSDAINGNPDGLLRADNLRIDKLGVTGLRDGDRILGTSLTYASRFYSKIIEGSEHIWTAYGLPVSSIVRTLGYTSVPSGVITNTPGAGSASDHATFGDALGYVLAIAGKFRCKDPVLTAAKPLGLLTPSDINGRGPRLQANSASTLTFPAATNVVQGSGTVAAVNVDNTTLEGAIAGATSLTTANTVNIGGGRIGRDITQDIIQIPLTINNTSPDKVVKVVVDFILDGTPTSPSTYANYYELTFAGDWLPSGTGVSGIVSAKRENAVRYGNDQSKDWTNVIGFRCYILSTDNNTEAVFGPISFKGGPGGVNGVYNYIQVDISDTGRYLAKSPISPVGYLSSDPNKKDITVINGSVTITPVVRDTNTTEYRFYRRSVADLGVDPNTGEPLNTSFLNTYYYVGSVKATGSSTSFIDYLSDDEVLQLNADGSFLPNLFLATLNSNDSVNGLQDTIYGIEGLHKDRVLYLTLNKIYISDSLNPDAVDLRFTLIPSGDSSEKNLWIKQLTNDVLILGTTKNLYEISGTFGETPDGSIDVSIRPIGEAFPPLSIDVCKWKGGLIYVAADGLRVTTGSNTEYLSPQLRELFKPILAFSGGPQRIIHGIPAASVYSGIGVDYGIAAAHQKIYFIIPCQDGTRRLIAYDTVTQSYNLIYADPIIIHATEAGELLASFLHQYQNSSSLLPSTWLMDAFPGYGFNGTQGLQFKLRTVFDANGQPRNRKDTFTLKLILDTGGRDVSVSIQKDGAGVTESDETTWISLGTISANGQQTRYIRLDSSQVTLGFRYALQIQDVSGVFTFKLYEATIEYEPRPEQLNYLRILPTNLGTVSRKRWTTFAFIIDTLGNSISFTPYLDNVAWGTTGTVNTGTKLTYIFYFDSEAIATDMGGVLIGSSGAVFEFYQINLEESISEKLPPPTTYLVIPGNNYGTPNRKRHTSYKFQINTRGKNVKFTPVLDGVSYSPTTYNTSRKQTVDYYFPQSDGDVIGVDIGGILESTENPKQPFEYYGTTIPQTIETLPDRLEYLRIPNSNFGTADRKRIRTISLVLDTRGQSVVFTPYVDNQPYSKSAIFTTTGKSTVWFYFDTDIIGVDFGGVLSTTTGQPFEFYALGTPDNVEPLPLPVKYYIIPPTNYGTPNRKRHTSYKWQMITRGGRVKFTPIVDRQVYEPSIYVTEKKQLCEYFFPQRPPQRFDDFPGGGDVIGIDVGGILESLDDTPFEFYETVTPQKIEILPDRLQYLRIPNTNFGVAARKRIRTIPIVIDTYGYLVRYTPIVDDVLYPPSFWRTYSKTTVHHFFDQDIFGTDFGGILSCEGDQVQPPITTTGFTFSVSDALSISDFLTQNYTQSLAVDDMIIISGSIDFLFLADVFPPIDVNFNLEDTVGITDSLSIQVNAVHVIADINVQIGDSYVITEQLVIDRRDSNSFSLADALSFLDNEAHLLNGTAAANVPILISNNIVLSDSVTRTVTARTLINTSDKINLNDAVTINVGNSNETALLQTLINNTPNGGTLTLNRLYNIYDTVYVDGRSNITITGGGILVKAGTVSGPNNTIFYIRNSNNTTISNFEINSNNFEARPMFIDGGNRVTISNVTIHDVATGAISAIGARVASNIKVQNCTIYNTQTDVRGVWLGAGNDYVTSAEVSGCTIHDIGHSGIAIEGSNSLITNNTLYNGADGAGFKVIARGTGGTINCTNNSVTDWTGGASVEGSGVTATAINITGNSFTRCRVPSTTFGSLYVAGNYTWNLNFSTNTITDCGSVGALRNARNSTFSGNLIPSGNNQLHLESDDTDVFITTGGVMFVDSTGDNLHHVVVDGVTIIP